eukprot:68490_1
MDYMADQQNNYQLIWMINKQIIKPEIISFKTIPQNSVVCNRLGESVPDLNVIEQVRGSRYIPNRLLNEGRNIFICTPGKAINLCENGANALTERLQSVTIFDCDTLLVNPLFLKLKSTFKWVPTNRNVTCISTARCGEWGGVGGQGGG